MINIENEIKFKTARSSGSGGQHVNKVETMVEGFWHIEALDLCSVQEKQRIFLKLKNRINKEGFLLVKSQSERS
jgi:ribosome-associated protein